MIDKFYRNYNRIQLSEIICKFDENKKFTATIATQNEVCGEFIFDAKTGYAKDKNTDIIIDFVKRKVITELKNEANVFSITYV